MMTNLQYLSFQVSMVDVISLIVLIKTLLFSQDISSHASYITMYLQNLLSSPTPHLLQVMYLQIIPHLLDVTTHQDSFVKSRIACHSLALGQIPGCLRKLCALIHISQIRSQVHQCLLFTSRWILIVCVSHGDVYLGKVGVGCFCMNKGSTNICISYFKIVMVEKIILVI